MPPITNFRVRNLKTDPSSWRLLAALLLAAPSVLWTTPAFSDPHPIETTETLATSSVASVALDSQQSAGNLAKSIIAQYKPVRTLEDFLPAQWGTLNPTESASLAALYTSWEGSGHLSDQEVLTWIKQSIASHRTAPYSAWQKLKKSIWARFEPSYRMRFVPQCLREAFAAYSAYVHDARRPVERIEVSRIDAADHPELASVLVWLKSEGFWIDVTTVTPQQVEERVAELTSNTDKELVRMVSGVDNVLPAAQRASLRKRFLDQLLYQLGIVRGVSLIQFHMANVRTPLEKGADLAVSGAVAAAASYCVFHSVEALQASGAAVTTWFPILVSISERLVFTYFGRPISAFFGQGKTFNFTKHLGKNVAGEPVTVSNTFETNKMFFFLTAFANSLFCRELVMAASHTHLDLAEWTVGFGLTWTLVADAAKTSIRGIFSKFSLQQGIEKLRRTLIHRPWLTFSILAVWNATWSMIGLGDLYDWSFNIPVPGIGDAVHVTARGVMTTLALTGLAHEQIRDRQGWLRRGRLVLEKLGLRKKTACVSLLVVHPASPSSSTE